MKKILLMLGFLAIAHINADAQTNATTTPNARENMGQTENGQKLDIVTGVKNNGNNTQRTGSTTTNTMHHAAVTHSSMHHTAAHHGAMHHTTHHYAKSGMHHNVHSVAMHKTAKHSYNAHYTKSGTNMNAAGMNSNMADNKQSVNNTTTMNPAHNQNADVNRKIPTTPYPGASNGGWSDHTNGRSGTNTEDGTIKTQTGK